MISGNLCTYLRGPDGAHLQLGHPKQSTEDMCPLQHAGYQPVELLETERCVACVALDGGAMVGLGRME